MTLFQKLLESYSVTAATVLVTAASCFFAAVLVVLFDLLFKGRVSAIDIVIAVLIALAIVAAITHGLLSLAGGLRQANSDLEQHAKYDYLTGILNRRAFMEQAIQEVGRAIRYQRPIAILLIDVDYFKQINDRFGHAAGDSTLIQFTAGCSGELRECDIFARYGGEEFILLLPESDLESALHVADRLRQRVKSSHFRHNGAEIDITVSIGAVSVIPGASRDAPALLEALLTAADQAMYEGKDKGRDQVITKTVML